MSHGPCVVLSKLVLLSDLFKMSKGGVPVSASVCVHTHKPVHPADYFFSPLIAIYPLQFAPFATATTKTFENK